MRFSHLLARCGPHSPSRKGENDKCVHDACSSATLQPISCSSLFRDLYSDGQQASDTTAAHPSRTTHRIQSPIYILGSGLVQTLLAGMLEGPRFAHALAFSRPSTPDRNLWFGGINL
jgi:hypothetical protein